MDKMSLRWLNLLPWQGNAQSSNFRESLWPARCHEAIMNTAVGQWKTSRQKRTNQCLLRTNWGIVLFLDRKFAAKGMAELEASSSSEEKKASIYAWECLRKRRLILLHVSLGMNKYSLLLYFIFRRMYGVHCTRNCVKATDPTKSNLTTLKVVPPNDLCKQERK